tara:strand:- start:2712 stop:3416 length:705 start_codon:yes stop_codon:yes gene_type:complete
MFSVSKHMLKSKGVRTTYYNRNLTLDTDNIIHKNFIKNINPDKPRGENTFYKELNILKFLEKNFVNKPKIDHYPFPKVISHGETRESGKLTISMTFCGINAIENACLYSEKKNIIPTNYYNTVECIINNLKNNSILYLDWKGDNVCINKYGHISLIDFGRFKILKEESRKYRYRLDKMYAKPDLNELKKSFFSYVSCSESEFLLEKALLRDKDGRLKWKHKLFKRAPWGMLYYF